MYFQHFTFLPDPLIFLKGLSLRLTLFFPCCPCSSLVQTVYAVAILLAVSRMLAPSPMSSFFGNGIFLDTRKGKGLKEADYLGLRLSFNILSIVSVMCTCTTALQVLCWADLCVSVNVSLPVLCPETNFK